MISRVADRCFWLGRYLERMESASRLLMVTHNFALGGELSAEQIWTPVVIVAGERARFGELVGATALTQSETVERYLVWDERSPASLISTVAGIRENARAMRDVISQETWLAVNAMWLRMRESGAEREWTEHRTETYGRLIKSCQFVSGLLMSTMLRDAPLDFIRLGMLLERAGQTARVLDVHHHGIRRSRAHQVLETALWLSLLRACCGYEPFMKRHRGRVHGDAVASFLLLEPRFPRSISFCLAQARQRLEAIRPSDAPADRPGAGANAHLRGLAAWIADIEARTLVLDDLHAILTHVIEELHLTCEQIGAEFLGYAGPASVAAGAASPTTEA